MNKNFNRDEYINWIRIYLADITGTTESKIDISAPFFDLGVSSLEMVQFTKDVSEWSKVPFEVSDLFNYSSIIKFAEFGASYNRSKTPNDIKKQNSFDSENIAVVGLSCQLPEASSLDKFWELLKNEKSAIKEVSENRYDRKTKFKMYSGQIDHLEDFDYEHFNISADEAKNIDVQQKVLMNLSWAALEHAGITPSGIKGSNTGVFVGISTHDHTLEKAYRNEKVSVFDATGGAHGISANRLSYYYDFLGPSMSVDTACSSSLLATHLACNSLKLNECEMALVGGVNIISSPILTESFQKAGMLSPTGSCKTFSEGADGYVRAEGGGFLVLKKLSKALEDGDQVHAVILGSAVNQDGRTNTITAPNGLAQERCILQAQRNASLNPEDIDFIEAHGTGTPLGDPIEYNALKKIFKDNSDKVYLGSVKTNIGHLEAGAGIAGAIKSVLSLKNRYFPRSLNFTTLNSNLSSENSNLEIATEAKTWEKTEENKRIGVSSFGFGGTNAHVIFGEYRGKEKRMIFSLENCFPKNLYLLSTNSIKKLEEYGEVLSNSILQQSDVGNLSYTLLNCRDRLKVRSFFVASDKSELTEKLERVKAVRNIDINTSKLTFAFTGQGSQYPKMGIELYQYFSIYRNSFNEVIEKFQSYFEDDLFDIWENNTEQKIYRTDYGQALIFAYQYSYVQLLKSLGIIPTYVFGHSLGEITASICSEFLSLEDGVFLIARRGHHMQKSPAGKMISINCDGEKIKNLLGEHYHQVDIATRNTNFATVLSGDERSVEKSVEILQRHQVKCTYLKVQQAFHSRLMDDCLENFKSDIEKIHYKNGNKKLISCQKSSIIESKDLSSSYWKDHLRKETNFLNISPVIKNEKIDTIVEIGPHSILKNFLKINLGNSLFIEGSGHRKDGGLESFWNLVGSLWASGVDINWAKIFENRSYEKLTIPVLSLGKEENISKRKGKIVLKFDSEREVKDQLVEMVARQFTEGQLVDQSEALMILGLDSLSLMGLVENINETFDLDLNLGQLLSQDVSIESLAQKIYGELKRDHQKENDQQKVEPSDLSLTEHQSHYIELLKSLDPNEKLYAQDSACFELKGELKLEKLKQSIRKITNSDELFLLSLDLEDNRIRKEERGGRKISCLDFSSCVNPQVTFKEWIDYRVSEVIENDFVDFSIVKISKDVFYFHILFNKIALNNTSINIIMKRLASLYNGEKLELEHTLYVGNQVDDRSQKLSEIESLSRLTTRISSSDYYKNVMLNKEQSNSVLSFFIAQIAKIYSKITNESLDYIHIMHEFVDEDWFQSLRNGYQLIELNVGTSSADSIDLEFRDACLSHKQIEHGPHLVLRITPSLEKNLFNDLSMSLYPIQSGFIAYPIMVDVMIDHEDLLIHLDYQPSKISDEVASKFLNEFTLCWK